MGSKYLRKKKCRLKTAKGNVFDSPDPAWAHALRMRSTTGDWIRAYQCLVCRRWHVGNAATMARFGRLKRSADSMQPTIAQTETVGALDLPDYHGDKTHVSHSSLETYRRSVRMFQAVNVLGEDRREESDAMALGSALHAAVLEPKVFEERYLVLNQEFDMRRKADKDEYAALVAGNPGKAFVTLKDWRKILGMRSGVLRNPVARMLIEAPGLFERAVQCVHPATGLRLKCKPDKYVPGVRVALASGPGVANVITDLKTTTDPAPAAFARSYYNFGYHRQAAFYLDAWELAWGPRPDGFLFIAVGSSFPHDCIVYEASRRSVQQGRHDNEQDLSRLSYSRDFDSWWGTWEQSVVPLDLPPWADRMAPEVGDHGD